MNPEQYEACKKLLATFYKEEMLNTWSWPFMEPVPKEVPDYYTIIKKPMDIGTIKKKLGSKLSRCKYSSHERFAKDVRLVFQNALLYNKADADIKGSVYDAAKHLLEHFEAEYKIANLPPTPSQQGETPSSSPQPSSESHHEKKKAESKKSVSKSSTSEKNKMQDTVSSEKPVSQDPTRKETGGSGGSSDSDLYANILAKLERHKVGKDLAAFSFMEPVDSKIYADYPRKIKSPMDLKTVKRKIRKNAYTSKEDFGEDVRLVFSNCLEYNCDPLLGNIRDYAVGLMKVFEKQFEKVGGRWPGIPQRWEAHQALEAVLKHRSPLEGVSAGDQELTDFQTASIFCFAFENYYPDDTGPEIRKYYSKIKRPMYLGLVSRNLHLGKYKKAQEFVDDTNLVFDNCVLYWSKRSGGQQYCDMARELKTLFKTACSGLALPNVEIQKSATASVHPSSVAAASPAPSSTTSSTVKQEPGKEEPKKSSSKSKGSKSMLRLTESERQVCAKILDRLRKHSMTLSSGMEVMTSGPFLTAVDVTVYTDYPKIVKHPMDLKKIEKSVKSGRYVSMEEFRSDLYLMIDNCFAYNSDPVQCADIRLMATKLRELFDKLYERFLSSGALESPPAAGAGTDPASAAPVKPKKVKKLKQEPSVTTQEQSPKLVAEAQNLPQSEGADEPDRVKKEKKHKKEKKKKHKKERKHKRERDDDGGKSDGSFQFSGNIGANDGRQNPVKYEPLGLRTPFDSPSKVYVKTSQSPAKEHSSPDGPIGISAKLSSSSGPVPRPVPRSPGSLLAPEPALPPPPAPMLAPPVPVAVKSVAKKTGKTAVTGEVARGHGREFNEYESSCDRVLRRMLKHEWVTKYQLNQPVLEVHPNLRRVYLAAIAKPMDLGTIHILLQQGKYQTSPARFVADGRLVFQNALDFNVGGDEFSVHIREVCQHLLVYWNRLCYEMIPEFGTVEEVQSTNRAKLEERTAREAMVRTAPMRQKQRDCAKLMRSLLSQKYDKVCWPFRQPVQDLFPDIADDYYQAIERPMDLRTINEKLSNEKAMGSDLDDGSHYVTYGDFADDIRLTFDNALQYNARDKQRTDTHMATCLNTASYRLPEQKCCGCGTEWTVYGAALEMKAIFEEAWAELTLEVAEKIGMEEIERQEFQRLQRIQRDEQERREAEELEKRRAEYEKLLAEQRKAEEEYEKEVKERMEREKQMNNEISKENKLARERLLKMNKTKKKLRKAEEQQRNNHWRRTIDAAFAEAVKEAEQRSKQNAAKIRRKQAQEENERRKAEQKKRKDEAATNAQRQLNIPIWEQVLQKRLSSANSETFWIKKKRLCVAAPSRNIFFSSGSEDVTTPEKERGDITMKEAEITTI